MGRLPHLFLTCLLLVGCDGVSEGLRIGPSERLPAEGLVRHQYNGNALQFSEDLDKGIWSKVRVSIVPDVAVAPDGTITADAIVEDATSTYHRRVQQFPALDDNTVHTFSVFAKGNGRDISLMFRDKTGATAEVFFDLTVGVIREKSGPVLDASIIPVVQDYFRCSITINTLSGEHTTATRILLSEVGGDSVYIGNGSSGALIWGAQVNTGSSPAAYTQTLDSTTPARAR